MSWRILEGDCVERMRELDEASIDAIVTDPPYGIGFMGKEWDGFTPAALARKTANHEPIDHKKQSGRSASMHAGQYDLSTTGNHRFQAWCETWAREALRVLKPGGHILAFGGTRTYHRLASAIEDAGFEIRDTLAWMYGSGFPKSLDVSKAIDKNAGIWPGRAGTPITPNVAMAGTNYERTEKGTPATEAAREWEGWGTALKPAWESVVVATKPLELAGILDTIGSHLDRLEAEWQAQAPDRKTRIGRAAGSSAATAMSPSESDQTTCWNIVSSWRACWVEVCEATSTSITGITFDPITDLTTLSFSLSRITLGSILRPASNPPGLTAIASAVDALFASVACGWRAILALSAVEPAIDSTPRSLLGGTDRVSPSLEPIVLARKPLAERTVAGNVLEHGTGALNIDGCRIGTEDDRSRPPGRKPANTFDLSSRAEPSESHEAGRWPANVLLDPEAAALLDEQSGELVSGPESDRGHRRNADSEASRNAYGGFQGQRATGVLYGDRGGASRFFYTAKTSTSERNVGLGHLPNRPAGGLEGRHDGSLGSITMSRNTHPTVKPVELMQWLCRLVTPKGGLILDPFTGSGSTGMAALREGFKFLGIEREPEYVQIARARIVGDAPLFNQEGDSA